MADSLSPPTEGVSTPPELIYSGPIPARPTDYYALAQPAHNRRFIYMLLSADGTYVYIGRSWQPGARFDCHRRRAWWDYVDFAFIYQVEAPTAWQADSLVSAYELAAIRTLDPAFNVAGVA